MRFKVIKVLALLFVIISVILSSGTAAVGTGRQDNTGRFNMSYAYFGSSGAYTSLVDKTGNSLDDVAPSYFDLNDDGTLKLTMAVDQSFVRDMHARNVNVTPFLSNHWDQGKGITALRNGDQLSSQIADAISQYDLDGVNVDIENVTSAEKDLYTDFVRLLREKLPEGKSVSVAVAPNPYHATNLWFGSFDYAGLAQYCDYLMLMAYDESYQGGDEGPVAGYPFVESSIKAALETVPADKLVLGIPFYGRLWKQGASYGGYGISNNTVENLIKKYSGTITYDYAKKSPKAVITIKPADPKPTVSGKTLDAGKYDIWYENETSIKRKLELVGKYNLKGTGSWSLGQESASTWDYYSMWLDGKYYGDIEKSWAKQEILTALNNGWMEGMSPTVFMPDGPVTRAQAATLLVRILGIDKTSIGTRGPMYSDIYKHWAYDDIQAATAYGLFEGVGGSRFAPDQALTREQMALLLDRIMSPGTDITPRFSDVTAETSPWSYEAIDRMAAAGMFEGYGDGTFHPGEIINRAQIAVLLGRVTPSLDNVVLAMNN